MTRHAHQGTTGDYSVPTPQSSDTALRLRCCVPLPVTRLICLPLLLVEAGKACCLGAGILAASREQVSQSLRKSIQTDAVWGDLVSPRRGHSSV